MKKTILLSILFYGVIYSQMLPAYYQNLVDKYNLPDRGSSISGSHNNTKIDLSGYNDYELFVLDSLGVLEELIDTTSQVDDGKTYFGYDFFNAPDKFKIFENIPAPSDYRLGPGDNLLISMWGDNQMYSEHVIDRDGNIFIDVVGQLNITGQTITEVKSSLFESFSHIYSTLNSRRPTTFINVSMGQLKSINITFIGEVKIPGTHAVHPFSDITTGLLQVGGVDTVGSLREIHIIRDNSIYKTLDFYEFLLDGKVTDNIRLINGDIVFVPVRSSKVLIGGEVNRPGYYETKGNESIAQLIHYAGGLTPTAQAIIEIRRLAPRNKRVSEDYAYDIFYTTYEKAENELAENVDQIIALPVPEVTREVSVLGQVKHPGTYAYEDSMRVLDILDMAGGLNDESFWESIYVAQAEIIRQNPKSVYPQQIYIDLNKLKDNDDSQNIYINNSDIIIVRENLNYTSPKYITFAGEVNIPGKYTIQTKEETLNQILQRAGGFSENAYRNGLQLYRDSVQVVLKDLNIFVADGDSIYIPEPPGVVKVEGHVQRRGLVQYVKGKSLNYYIEKAGGYTYMAKKNRIAVHYANGDVKLKSNVFNSPKILDGATIIVFQKQPKLPFDVTGFLSAAASAATSIYLIYTVYQNSQN